MVLNYIWIAFFLIAFVIGLIQLIFFGNVDIFPALINSTFDNSKLGFEISLWLTGAMTMWLGIMKIGEKGGMIRIIAKVAAPLLRKLFPEIPENHPANGSIIMNIAANMLGLDNAATPMGLKAMKELQELNPDKDKASNAQIMFLVLNTSGLTIIPVAIMAVLAANGSKNPSEVFIPILISTFISTLVGIIVTSLYQRINLINKAVILYLGGFSIFVSFLIYYFVSLPQEEVARISSIAGTLILFTIIISFILVGMKNKINIYESFIEGAKEGFSTSIMIIPYLVAILIAIGVFRASGAMDFLMNGISYLFGLMNVDTGFVNALPTAIMRPLSGSGSRGMMIEAIKTYGVDSFTAKVAATFQGATDTTFYIIAVYFGSISVRNTRYAITAGLLADLAGVIAAIVVSYIFYV